VVRINKHLTWKLSKKARRHWNDLSSWMSTWIFSIACSHFLKSTFSLAILGQNNGNVVQCYLRGLWDGSIRGVGQTRVKWSGHTLSKFGLAIPSGEKKGALGWGGLELVICSEAFKLSIKVGVAFKWTSLLIKSTSLVYFHFPKANPLFSPPLAFECLKMIVTLLKIPIHISHVMKSLEVDIFIIRQLRYNQ
jgi:hypothetical protein